MSSSTAAAPEATQLRVLVVDDDRAFLDLIGKIVSRARPDAKVHLHSDPEAALSFYQACWQSIDVVLLDLMIGDTHGLDLAARLRAINPLERVVLMSGFSTDAWVGHEGRDHVALFLQKGQIGASPAGESSALPYFLDRAAAARRADASRERLQARVRELEERALMCGYVVRDLEERLGNLDPSLAKELADGLHDLAELLGRPEPCGEECALEDVVQAALQSSQELLRKRHVEVDVRPLLPSVQAPAALAVQVVTQLISAAVHLVGPGQVPNLRFHCSERGERVRLWIDHNGLGVSEEEADRVFRLFGRMHATQGLHGEAAGLAAAQRTVARLGGTLGMQATQRQGGRFWLDLPAAGGSVTD